MLKIERGTIRGSNALLAGIQNARAVPGNEQARIHQEDWALDCGVQRQDHGRCGAQRDRGHQHVFAVVDVGDMPGDRERGRVAE